MATRAPLRADKAGPAARHEALGLTRDDLLAMYSSMRLARLIDQRYWQMNRIGKAPFVISAGGHEAAQVGVAWAMDRTKDWAAPYYRDMALCLVMGQTPLDMMLSLFAKADDTATGGRQMPGHFGDRKRRILTGSSPVGTQFPHAVGIALAQRQLRTGAVTWALGGEGATSTGDWHEALNFASVHKLAVVFCVENNRYAISVPQEKQMAVRDLADRGAAYAVPGHAVDGMDVLASYEVAKAARARAAAGQGPTLIELKCYRYVPHSSDDDDRQYRTREEIAEWRKKDPIDRFVSYLDSVAITAEERGAIDTRLQADVDAALDVAQRHPDPRPEDGDTNVYAQKFGEGLRG